MKALLLNGKQFTYNYIKSGEWKSSNFSDFESNTLSFSQKWLSGEKEFSISTSGSTGTPKIIKISRSQMIASAKLTTSFLRLQKGDSALVCLNTAYIAGRMMLVRSFELGMNIIAVEPSSNPLENLSRNDKIDFTALVPLQMQTLLETEKNYLPQLNQMKGIIIGGAAVNPSLEEKLQLVKSAVYSTYGMTETVSHIALKRLNGPEKSDYYQIFEGIETELDERSCLCIQGSVSNNEKVITNDIVEFNGGKTFKWIGRADNIINSGGVKIFTEKVENIIDRLFGELSIKRRFFLYGIQDEKLGQKVSLFIEGTGLPLEKHRQLKNGLQKALSKFEVPKDHYFIPTFQETETGKIQRQQTANSN
ncbi:AMP-binding protein [Xanthovirga aplysinae]|uniref:AMP-binding protein n=1 Tax=Xanthovirga aplysinae TaxID=2529853 RepID=UPI001656CF6C|nr:AMP-binding protein [Xanthovirga aplysinae]